MRLKSFLSMPLLGVAAVFFLPGPCLPATGGNTGTIRALKDYYMSEKTLATRYKIYALQAREEKLPNFAALFSAFSAAESVHAENGKKLLQDLGAKALEPIIPTVGTQSTKDNLAEAAALELNEIDKEYPKLLRDITPEGNTAVIKQLTWHWQSEKAQQKILKDILANTGFTFLLLIEKIERHPVAYLICQICGFVAVKEAPPACPVCNNPPSVFKKQ